VVLGPWPYYKLTHTALMNYANYGLESSTKYNATAIALMIVS
jgi:hypothetical protein